MRILKKSLSAVLILVLVFCMTACGKKGSETADNETLLQLEKPATGDTIVEIKTNKGSFSIVLYPQYAPKAVENFLTLAQSGYYDDLPFHKVIDDFVIQTGDPSGTGTGGESIWGSHFENETTPALHNFTGAVGMASDGSKNGNGSQFYIVASSKVSDETVQLMRDAEYSETVIEAYKSHGGLPQLDLRYTVFGQVVTGLDVIEKIASAKVDEMYRPTNDIVIKSISVYTYGS